MNTVNQVKKKRSVQAYISIAAAALSLVIAIGFCIYGAVFDYFDVVVLINLLVAALASGIYFFYSRYQSLRFLNLLAVFLVSFALAFFFMNSFPVWADELNNITMYGSRGGLAPVITIMIAMIACILVEIVVCFMPEKEEE